MCPLPRVTPAVDLVCGWGVLNYNHLPSTVHAFFPFDHHQQQTWEIALHLVDDLLLVSLAISLGGIVTLVHDEIFRSVIFSAGEVALQDCLGACGVSFLGIDGGTGHVGDHGVTASPWVLGGSEWVVTGCGLREPDVTSVSVELAGLEGLGNVFLDDNGATGGVDEPGTC